MTESHPLQSVIHNIIERYLARYESVSVGIYRFHAINGGEFSKYLNSLKITLSRKAFIPTYCWHYDPYGEGYILFLFICDGCGRYDLSDLHPIIQRLWAYHSPTPAEPFKGIRITINNAAEATAYLEHLTFFCKENKPCVKHPLRQRSYGVSQVI